MLVLSKATFFTAGQTLQSVALAHKKAVFCGVPDGGHNGCGCGQGAGAEDHKDRHRAKDFDGEQIGERAVTTIRVAQRSANRTILALLASADCTRAILRCVALSLPTRSARISKAPNWFTVPLDTLSPAALSIGGIRRSSLPDQPRYSLR